MVTEKGTVSLTLQFQSILVVSPCVKTWEPVALFLAWMSYVFFPVHRCQFLYQSELFIYNYN